MRPIAFFFFHVYEADVGKFIEHDILHVSIVAAA